MSAAFKCDRCGDVHEGEPAATHSIPAEWLPAGSTMRKKAYAASDVERVDVDLCEECNGELRYAWSNIERAG